MRISVPPPAIAIWIIASVALTLTIVLGLSRGPRALRAGVWLFGVGVCGTILYVAARPLVFSWDMIGITDHTFGAARTIPWREVREARVIHGYLQSEWRPTLRTNGTAYDRYRAGEFRAANGQTVRMFLMINGPDALLLKTANDTYLYSPDPFGPFVESVALNVPTLVK